jgi:hypothetical protein
MMVQFYIIFFYTCGVILWSEEYCSDEMPKFLTRKKFVVIWQPDHSCATIYLVCFNLFMFLSLRVRYSRVLQSRIYIRASPIVVLGPISQGTN